MLGADRCAAAESAREMCGGHRRKPPSEDNRGRRGQIRVGCEGEAGNGQACLCLSALKPRGGRFVAQQHAGRHRPADRRIHRAGRQSRRVRADGDRTCQEEESRCGEATADARATIDAKPAAAPASGSTAAATPACCRRKARSDSEDLRRRQSRSRLDRARRRGRPTSIAGNRRSIPLDGAHRLPRAPARPAAQPVAERPSARQTRAVIINEFGEVALDHLLVDYVGDKHGRPCNRAACAARYAATWLTDLRNCCAISTMGASNSAACAAGNHRLSPTRRRCCAHRDGASLIWSSASALRWRGRRWSTPSNGEADARRPSEAVEASGGWPTVSS